MKMPGAIVIAAVLFTTPAGAAEQFWFELHAVKRGTPKSEMRLMVKLGPFDQKAHCYGIGVVVIEQMNASHPTRDFAGRCEDGPLLSLFALSERAK